MRFDREPRPEGYCWTARKEALYLRRGTREVEKIARDYPLFVDQFRPRPTLPVGEERKRRERMLLKSDQQWRDLQARFWRQARSAYFACAPEMRAAIVAEWNQWRGPAKPLYFTYVVEKHNGVGEERSRRMRAQDAAMLARIRERETSQAALLLV
ncbi:conserved hypothetical protein [Paraburkholderia unamae]|uniref:hypothetical protein n=1 Tax=Paraburkholderia unamae TaxID=219649 RepID=UPI001CB52B48|nr:hypothetical protein [Paraburkholderia unamae]CAG9255019.1 conserved hypothetical protein [Paraburkholderia unamae]